MIICCEQCNTKFNVADSAIGKQGRAVRCSKCSHEWIAQSTSPTKAKPVKTVQVQQPKSAAVYTPLKRHLIKASPRQFPTPKLPFYARPFAYVAVRVAALATVLFFLGANLAYYHHELINEFSWLEKPYSWVGLLNNHNVKLEVVNCNVQSVPPVGGSSGTEVEVKVTIANTSHKDQTLPLVRFSIFDLDKKFVGELTLPINMTIPTGASTKVEGRLNQVPKNSFYVGIDIGDKFDVSMREPIRLFKVF